MSIRYKDGRIWNIHYNYIRMAPDWEPRRREHNAAGGGWWCPVGCCSTR